MEAYEVHDETWLSGLESLRQGISGYAAGSVSPAQLHHLMTLHGEYLRDPLYQRRRDAAAR